MLPLCALGLYFVHSLLLLGGSHRASKMILKCFFLSVRKQMFVILILVKRLNRFNLISFLCMSMNEKKI